MKIKSLFFSLLMPLALLSVSVSVQAEGTIVVNNKYKVTTYSTPKCVLHGDGSTAPTYKCTLDAYGVYSTTLTSSTGVTTITPGGPASSKSFNCTVWNYTKGPTVVCSNGMASIALVNEVCLIYQGRPTGKKAVFDCPVSHFPGFKPTKIANTKAPIRHTPKLVNATLVHTRHSLEYTLTTDDLPPEVLAQVETYPDITEQEQPVAPPEEITFNADGTWQSVDGTVTGGWSQVGGQVNLSGNSNGEGDTSVVQSLQPEVSLTGSWQTWSTTNPTASQDVYNVILEKQP